MLIVAILPPVFMVAINGNKNAANEKISETIRAIYNGVKLVLKNEKLSCFYSHHVAVLLFFLCYGYLHYTTTHAIKKQVRILKIKSK